MNEAYFSEVVDGQYVERGQAPQEHTGETEYVSEVVDGAYVLRKVAE